MESTLRRGRCVLDREARRQLDGREWALRVRSRLVFAVAIGLAMAATATVSRRSARRIRKARAIAAVQAIILGIVAGLLMGVFGAIFAPQLLGLMHATPEAIAAGSGYARVLFGSNIVIVLIFLINGIFRGAGDAITAMRTLWLSNAINIVLDPLFIYGIGPFHGTGSDGRGSGHHHRAIDRRDLSTSRAAARQARASHLRDGICASIGQSCCA